jgi:predicted protein tyrosine phosphatase
MNRITICGHATNQKSPAFKLLEANPGHWSVVFINNPGEPLPVWVKKLSKDVLHLQFDDILFPSKSLKMPDVDDVLDAMEWTKTKEDVLFTCHAGASRSAAMAYVCACQEFYPEDAIGILKPGIHTPNQKIVQFGVEALKDKRILEVFKEWTDRDYGADDIGIEYTKY